MSAPLVSAVLDRFPKPGSPKLLMVAFARWARDDGSHIFPSIRTISKILNCSSVHARRLVHQLIRENWVFCAGNQYGGDPGMSRRYRLNIRKLMACPVLNNRKGLMGERGPNMGDSGHADDPIPDDHDAPHDGSETPPGRERLRAIDDLSKSQFASLPESDGLLASAKDRALRLAVQLKKRGIPANGLDPRVLALAKHGVPERTVLDFVDGRRIENTDEPITLDLLVQHLLPGGGIVSRTAREAVPRAGELVCRSLPST